jgi:hypothetical protein
MQKLVLYERLKDFEGVILTIPDLVFIHHLYNVTPEQDVTPLCAMS